MVTFISSRGDVTCSVDAYGNIRDDNRNILPQFRGLVVRNDEMM